MNGNARRVACLTAFWFVLLSIAALPVLQTNAYLVDTQGSSIEVLAEEGTPRIEVGVQALVPALGSLSSAETTRSTESSTPLGR